MLACMGLEGVKLVWDDPAVVVRVEVVLMVAMGGSGGRTFTLSKGNGGCSAVTAGPMAWWILS